MPHHFTKNTVSASVWCPTCNKHTMHYVWDGRIGRCMNDHPQQLKLATEEKQPEQMTLEERYGSIDIG